MRKTLKNNKGVTLMSVIIYITIMFVVLAAIMRITIYFSDNMNDAADVSFETEFNKLNIYLLDEAKKTGNAIQEIVEDGTQVTFAKGNKYFYNTEDKIIYLNDTIKVCEGIESCLFEEEIAENGKSILVLTVKINGIEKTANYIMVDENTTQYITLLPDEYQQVEYIESTGTQYIDTGVKSNSNIKLETSINGIYDSSAWYGGRTGSYIGIYNYNGRFDWLGITGEGKSIVVNPSNNEWHNISHGKELMIDNQLIIEYEETEYTTDFNIYLFAGNNNGTAASYSTIKMKEIIIYENDNIVRDFIPCYRKSDGVVGLYDTVNDVFYTNAGTGTFEKGNNVIIVADNGNQDYINEEDYIIGSVEEDNFEGLYQQVEYIESSGTQYIDTEYIPSSNTSIEMKASNTSTTNACLYCARTAYQNNTYTTFLINGTALRADYGSTQYSNIMSATSDTVYVYKQNKNLLYIDGDLVKTLTETEFTCEYNMYLMASHEAGANISNIGNVKLYSCKIWDGETVVRDFIPCYRKSDGVAGLYDTVNDVFYTNAGTGTFARGPNVN